MTTIIDHLGALGRMITADSAATQVVEASPDVLRVAAVHEISPASVTVSASLLGTWQSFVVRYVSGLRLDGLVAAGWTLSLGEGCPDEFVTGNRQQLDMCVVHRCARHHASVQIVAHLAGVVDAVGIGLIGMAVFPMTTKVDLWRLASVD